MTSSPVTPALLRLAGALCLTALPQLTHAADLWVGSNAPEGATAYPTVQAALNAAAAGDTIHLAAGVYRERVVFKNDGTAEQPITLKGAGEGAIIDGSTPVELHWTEATDIGPGVYRTPLDFFPFTVTANGQTVVTLNERRVSEEGPIGADGRRSGIYWKTAFKDGVGRTGWDGVRALNLYRSKEKELLIRFKDQLDPRHMAITVAPREPVINTNAKHHYVVSNLTLRNSAIGVLITGSENITVEHTTIDPADYGIDIAAGARDAVIRFNRITLNPYAGADPWADGSWDHWLAVKVGGYWDRIGIVMRETRGGHTIHDNFIFDHWDGIDDHGNLPWRKQQGSPDDNSNLRVYNNLIYNLNDDGIETMGPGINGHWHDNLIIRTRCAIRIKAPQQGPLYIYRNIMLDNKEDLRNWAEGTQFHPEAEVWVYHNTSTSNAAVTMNYKNLKEPLTTPNYHYFNNLFWTWEWVHKSAELADPDWKTDNNVFILATPEFPRPWVDGHPTRSPETITQRWVSGIALAMKAKREQSSTWVGAGPAGFTDPANTDLSLLADSPARERGVNPATLSDKPLPGLEAGYFTGAAPDAGAVQYGQPMPQIPAFDHSPQLTASGNPARVVFVGASSVTNKHTGRDEAGWGWGLQHWATPGTDVINTAVGGRSSRSFRSEGRWEKAMALQPDWVLIQFGHNDQPGKGPERESNPETDYRDHLRQYITEARAQGARPVLVSPVCRRTYNSAGRLTDSLKPYAEATRIVAEEMGVPFLDLHGYSYEVFAKLDAQSSQELFAPSDAPNDRTHFSADASTVVAGWVLELMEQQVPELAARFRQPEPASTATAEAPAATAAQSSSEAAPLAAAAQSVAAN